MDHIVENFVSFQKYAGDPIMWLLLVRTTASIGVMILFFLEPMRCGGDNKRFHQFIGVFFGILAWAGIDRIVSRLNGLVDATGAYLPAGDIIWSQLALTAATVFLMGWLSYEWFKGKEYKKMKMIRTTVNCTSCPRKFEP